MNPDEQGVKKSLLVKMIIITIIAIIFFLWLFSLRNLFENKQVDNNSLLKKVSDDINNSLNETENRLNQITSSSSDSMVKDLLDKASSTAASKISTTTVASELKKELIDLTNRATITASTTIATTTLKKDTCPKYIDCMPTIGAAKPCVIPAGCEGITQIAY